VDEVTPGCASAVAGRLLRAGAASPSPPRVARSSKWVMAPPVRCGTMACRPAAYDAGNLPQAHGLVNYNLHAGHVYRSGACASRQGWRSRVVFTAARLLRKMDFVTVGAVPCAPGTCWLHPLSSRVPLEWHLPHSANRTPCCARCMRKTRKDMSIGSETLLAC